MILEYMDNAQYFDMRTFGYFINTLDKHNIDNDNISMYDVSNYIKCIDLVEDHGQSI